MTDFLTTSGYNRRLEQPIPEVLSYRAERKGSRRLVYRPAGPGATPAVTAHHDIRIYLRSRGDGDYPQLKISRNFLDDERWRKSVWGRGTPTSAWRLICNNAGSLRGTARRHLGRSGSASYTGAQGYRVQLRKRIQENRREQPDRVMTPIKHRWQSDRATWGARVPPTPPLAKRRRSTSAVSSFPLQQEKNRWCWMMIS